jgi:ankyrin repeat protein
MTTSDLPPPYEDSVNIVEKPSAPLYEQEGVCTECESDIGLNTSFHNACANGHMRCAERYVENGAKRFNDGLPKAYTNGYFEIAKLCVLHGACMDGLFEYACKNRNIDIAKWCINEGFKDVSILYSEFNDACFKGYLEIAKLCVHYGLYNINNGFVFACSNGQLECAKLCIDSGANDFNGGFNNACSNGHLVCAKLCLDSGASYFNRGLIGACKHGHLECVKLCTYAGASNFNEGLINACKRGHLECVKLCTYAGATNFERGMYFACENNHIDCVKFCAKHSTNTAYNAPFKIACENGHMECAKLCITLGTNLNSALTSACFSDKQAFINLCIESGATECEYHSTSYHFPKPKSQKKCIIC